MSERTRLIRASSDLLAMFGTRTADGSRLTAEWGEIVGHCPDSDEYIYEPTFTVHRDDSLIDAFLASPQAAEELARALNPVPFASCDVPDDEPFCEYARGEARREAVRLLAAWQKARTPEEA